MCYIGCKYENHHGGCNKSIFKKCPHPELYGEIDFPVCTNYEIDCVHNNFGKCEYEGECDYAER